MPTWSLVWKPNAKPKNQKLSSITMNVIHCTIFSIDSGDRRTFPVQSCNSFLCSFGDVCLQRDITARNTRITACSPRVHLSHNAAACVTHNVRQVMTEGIATFSGMSLDRSGHNLRLRFSMFSYDHLTGNWTDTGVNHTTRFFDVGEGLPNALIVQQVRVSITTRLTRIVQCKGRGREYREYLMASCFLPDSTKYSIPFLSTTWAKRDE